VVAVAAIDALLPVVRGQRMARYWNDSKAGKTDTGDPAAINQKYRSNCGVCFDCINGASDIDSLLTYENGGMEEAIVLMSTRYFESPICQYPQPLTWPVPARIVAECDQDIII